MSERRAIKRRRRSDNLTAYFTMEIAFDASMPTYSGGLGVLAGDTIRSAADLGTPMVVTSLLHRKGYFDQHLSDDGWQTEEPVNWVVDDYLKEQEARTSVSIEGRDVALRAWKYEVVGLDGAVVPVFFLDSDLPENDEWDRSLTNFLYGGDQRYRLGQEIILGIGGVRMLHALGYTVIERYHMNEGHASLLTLELLEEFAHEEGRTTPNSEDIERVRNLCVFTTHTPVRAGHDQFPMQMAAHMLGLSEELIGIKGIFSEPEVLNMTLLALNLSYYVNGVAKKHGEISEHLFAPHAIHAITNGVHAATWVCEPFEKLFSQYIEGWPKDNFSLRFALGIPKNEIWEAHEEAKSELIAYVNRETNSGMERDVLTLGYARRAAAYKRGDLVLTDLDRLKHIAEDVGPLQIVYAGKAHPKDQAGKEIIQRIFRAIDILKDTIKIVYLENYDKELAKLMTSGVDIWLNTPQPPLEASGTSGMKAALNGVPNFSILDGWWIEGNIEGVTGWSIGNGDHEGDVEKNRARDVESLYGKLEHVIVPLFYNNRSNFIEIMRHSIALNGSFFNTHRMLQQYVVKAYLSGTAPR